MIILLTLIFVMLLLLMCALCAWGGYFFAIREKIKRNQKGVRKTDEITARKVQHEYSNFLNYKGDEMPEFKL